MPSTATDSADVATTTRLPEVVDWLVGAVIALAGLVSLLFGSLLVFIVDRRFLVDFLDTGTETYQVMATELTRSESLEVGLAVVHWTGVGLLITALGLLVFAVWYVRARHRSHAQARAGSPTSSFGAFAVIGALATLVLSALPFSPLLGGAIAGYLERAESSRTVSVGALSGGLYLLPAAVILVFVLGGIWTGFQAIGEAGLGIAIAGILLVGFGFAASFSVGLSAIGGYAGGWVAER